MKTYEDNECRRNCVSLTYTCYGSDYWCVLYSSALSFRDSKVFKCEKCLGKVKIDEK